MIILDNCEYATDAAALAAYPSSASIDAYVKLLCHFDSTLSDDSGNGHTITNSNASISATQSKFGGKSAYLNSGLGSYFYLDGSSNFSFPGDYTIDFQFYKTGDCVLYDQRPTSTNGYYPYIAVASGKLIVYYNNSQVITGATSVIDGAWHHAALVRTNGVMKLFLDGNQQGSDYSDSHTVLCGANRPIFGTNGYNIGVTGYMQGYIDELRISNGIARWTTTFTPLALAYTNALYPYSGTTKYLGDYSLKLVATTDALNGAVTKTFSPTLYLADQTSLNLWIYASRTGTNLKVGIHDTGGTTTESNIAISNANTWELKSVDISAVSSANKDAIDKLIFTIINSDDANTIYIDNIYTLSPNEIISGIIQYNRNSFLPMRGRLRDLPFDLVKKTTLYK